MKKRNISQKCRFLALQRSSGKTEFCRGDRCVVCACMFMQILPLFRSVRGVSELLALPGSGFNCSNKDFVFLEISAHCSALEHYSTPAYITYSSSSHFQQKGKHLSTHSPRFPPSKKRSCPCQKLKRGEGKEGWSPHHKSLPMPKGETHSGGFYRRNYHLVKKRKRPHAGISQIGFVVSAVPFPAVLKGNAVVFPPFFVVDGKPCGEPIHLFQSG